jgi:hypothetical protein
MNNEQRLHLQNMISANNVEDQTGLIRELKHSVILREEVNNLVRIREKHNGEQEKIMEDAITECNFMFTYYTDIYNKIRKDEIDLQILHKFLDVLRDIEDGKLDQHEGSFKVGTLLKEIYVDSALRKAEKLNENNDNKEPEYKGPQVEISWKDFKDIQKGLKK